MGKEKYEDALLQSISILADQAVKKAGYDKTIRATIIKCVDPSIEQYKIKYQDGYFYAYGNGAGVNYPVGANVYILVPKGDMSQLKTILGTVQKLGINYVNPIAEENKYEETGNNVVKTLSEEEFGLCSYKTEDAILLYDITPEEQKDHIKKIDINNKNLKYYLQTASHLCCSFYIRTDLNNQQKYKGKYGIKITAKYKDVKDKDSSITQDHIIDIDIMEGNPYNFEKAVLQKVFIEIDTINFQEIVKVQLFSKGFPNIKENPSDDEKDIFFSDLSFQGMKMLTQEEMDTVALSLVAKKGYIFEGQQLTQLPIEAVVRAAGKVVNNSLQVLKYYWFVKNVTITASSVYYCKEGGQGWKCLNNYKTISKDKDGEPTKIQYNSAGPTLKIKEDEVKIKESKYKCVVVYGNASYSKEFTIRNENADYEITITSNKGTVFESGLGKPTLTCKILQNTKEVQDYNNYIFNWIVTDQVGVSTEIGTEREISYDVQKIIGFNKFSCTVTDKNFNLIGTAEITLVNKKTSDGGFKLIIENGQQVFNYNEQGVSPCKNKLIDFAIPQLSFTLYDKMGQKVDQDLIDSNNITWRIKGSSNIINSLTIADNKKTAEYTIHDYFQSSVGDDNIELTVNYAGYKLVATTNFIFTQQGYSGTNGTGMVAVIKVIYKDSLKDNNHVPVLSNISGDTNFTNLTAELYRNGEKVTTDVTYGWRVLKNRQDNTYININPTDKKDTVTITKKSTPTISGYKNPFSNIVQVQIIHDKKNYFATLPIITTDNTNEYYIYLEENSGYNEVLYTQDGLYPKYTKKPFVFKVKNKNNGNDVTNSAKFIYYADNNDLLKIVDTNLSACERKPASTYDGEDISKYIRCKATINNNILWINIPIYQHLNLYGHSALNSWNGNSIQLDGNDNGNPIILTPQIGAGKKEENTFTGIMMGTVRHYKDNSAIDETGLFGYKKGARSIFLDADTGNATFGIRGNGQIKITPDKGTITGGGYEDNNRTGMLIDLKTPEIKFGSGKFSVNSAGELTAQGGGSIAGWHIGPSALTKGDVGISSDNETGDKDNNKAFWAGKFSDDNTSPKYAPFSVDFSGKVVMKEAQIGGAFGPESNNKVWIKNGTIYTENVVQKENGTKYKGTIQNHNTFSSYYEGFYIGPDGFSLGKYFSVDNKGELIAKKGYIGNSTEGFWITDKNIHSNGKDEAFNNKKGVFLGVDKIALGPNAKFYVNDEGYLKAVHGTIAGWTINENAIYRDTDNPDYGTTKAKRDKNGNIMKDKDGKTIMEYVTPYKDGLYFGKGGLRMGASFHVDAQGNLYANNGDFTGKITSSQGNIAGWEITASALKAGNIEIRSDGAIKHKSGTWNINNDGQATFKDIKITGGNMSGGTIGGSGGSGGSHPRINPTNTDVGSAGGTTMNDWTVNTIKGQKAWFQELIATKISADYIVTKLATVNKLEVKGTIIASSVYANSKASDDNMLVRKGGDVISGIKTTLTTHTNTIADIQRDYATKDYVNSRIPSSGGTS